MADHIVSSYDEELRSLAQTIAQMGGAAEHMVENAVTALLTNDIELANETVAADREVDAMHRAIEERAVLVIARRQPMAQDLRETVGAIRISNDLERVGDLAKNMARRALAIDERIAPPNLAVGVEHLADLSRSQLKKVLDTCVTRDVEAARAAWLGDRELNAVYVSIFRELLTYMMEDPRTITTCTHLLFCAKNLERIGDHAKNVAETVVYVATGQSLEDGEVQAPRAAE